MKAKDVLRILGILRVTLMTYLKKKYITANKLPNGFYDYDDKSVYDFKNNYKRTNVIYSRVSTYKQKKI
jgi:predicted site-specific integrase-resolvase